MTPTTRKPFTLIAPRHSGTHLIQPLMRHLTGRTVYVPKGDDAIKCVPSPKCVVWLRDPRNIVIARYRFKYGRDLDPAKHDSGLAAMLRQKKNGETPLAYMLRWARRWKFDRAVGHVARFEEYTATDDLGRIVRVSALDQYLRPDSVSNREGDVSKAIAYAFGTSGTFTGRHSRWVEWFGPLTMEAWADGRGDHLCELMGYQ